MFVVTAAVYSLGYRLHTLTAVPRFTHSSFRPSKNNNGQLVRVRVGGG